MNNMLAIKEVTRIFSDQSKAELIDEAEPVVIEDLEAVGIDLDSVSLPGNLMLSEGINHGDGELVLQYVSEIEDQSDDVIAEMHQTVDNSLKKATTTIIEHVDLAITREEEEASNISTEMPQPT